MANEIIQLPLIKGQGKNPNTSDYTDFLPVNMLAVVNPVLNAAGYMRSFPGITKTADVGGLSRGGEYHTKDNLVYRVLGPSLYAGSKKTNALIPGKNRVSLAHSQNSQGVATEGKLLLWNTKENGLKTLENWPQEKTKTGKPKRDSPAQYEIGHVRDICHNRGRYIWVKDGTDTFGVTDLENESHPDRYRPFYRAESMPDGIQGVESWRDMVVAFGASSIEYFSLTGRTGVTDPIYMAQPAFMVNVGIAGTHCKCQYKDSFAIISHQAHGAPSVYLIDNGSKQCIATREIEKILASYSAEALATAVMENVRFDTHDLLIIHLPNGVLCFDGGANTGSPQWNSLKTGLYNEPWRGIDLVWDGEAITLGDKREGITGKLDFTCFSQYGEPQECVLTTPLIKADNALLFDFEIESVTGQALHAEHCFISATPDGLHYGREQLIPSNQYRRYDQRILWRRVGQCRKNMGFKLRFITDTPVSLAQCQLRINHA